MADPPRSAAAIASGPRRHDPHGGWRQRRIPRRLPAREADGVAPPARFRPSGRGRQVRADRGRQGGPRVVADLRLRRMGSYGLTGRPIIRQIAYWQGALPAFAAFLTSPQAPRSAIRDPMLLSRARASPAAAAE